MRTLRCISATAGAMAMLASSASGNPFGPIKWSQPPVVDDPGPPPVYRGWDQLSQQYELFQLTADDFQCTDPNPVIGVRWWGSYIDWMGSEPPGPPWPIGFGITFWTDMPAGEDPDPQVTWSHPDQRIWDVFCEDFTEQFVGYDLDPRTGAVTDATFEYLQHFQPDQYFHQEVGTTYWITIAALFTKAPEHAWGWKTRPHSFQDDAAFTEWPGAWTPLEYPPGTSWDTAFELFVPEPATVLLLALGGLGVIRRRK